MKNIIFPLLFALIILAISCNESILSKFHQTTFKIKDVRMESVRYSKKYYYYVDIKTFKFNRTTPAINVTLKMKISVEDKIEVVVQALKFLSNEYRHFPMRFQVNLQKTFESNAIGLKNILNCGNLTTCSFVKDVTYHVCNFIIDANHFPPLIPSGRFRIDVQMMYVNEEIAVKSLFFEIYTPIAYPKN